jgi:hypothetical protein
MGKHGACGNDKTGEKVAIVCQGLAWRLQPVTTGHQASVTKGRVGASSKTQLAFGIVRFGQNCNRPALSVGASNARQDSRQKDDLRSRWWPHVNQEAR